MSLGSVAVASPSTVMPHSLCSSFAEIISVPELTLEYNGGEIECSRMANTSRRIWRMTKQLTAEEHAELLEFWRDRKGKTEPFWFYHLTEATAGYDPTGAADAGRYTVRFMSSWQDSWSIARATVPVELIEIV